MVIRDSVGATVTSAPAIDRAHSPRLAPQLHRGGGRAAAAPKSYTFSKRAGRHESSLASTRPALRTYVRQGLVVGPELFASS